MNMTALFDSVFPYTRQPDSKSGVFGAQALLLPIITNKYDEFIQGDVIKLICIICGQIDRKPFCLGVPGELDLIISDKVIGVYSQTELYEMRYDRVTQELEEQISKQEEAEK